jgi:hypothetical protein
MANVFQKGTKFAQNALALLRRTVKAPGLFTTKYTIADFKGAEGDVINVKRPPVLRARDKGWRNDNAITYAAWSRPRSDQAGQAPYSAVELLPRIHPRRSTTPAKAPQVQALLDWYEHDSVPPTTSTRSPMTPMPHRHRSREEV